MSLAYRMKVAGLERDLPICKVTDDLFIAGFIMSKNPDYFQPMLESPMGKMLLVAAVVLELAAIFIIRKIIDIDA